MLKTEVTEVIIEEAEEEPVIIEIEEPAQAEEAVEEVVIEEAEEEPVIIEIEEPAQVEEPVEEIVIEEAVEEPAPEVVAIVADVAPEAVLEAAKTEKADIVGLSALMTTTTEAMAETVRLLNEELPQVKTVVGGAVLTKEFTEKISQSLFSA